MPPVIAAVAAFAGGLSAAAGFGGALSLAGLAAGGFYGAGASIGFAIGGFISAIGGIGTIISLGLGVASLALGRSSQPAVTPAALPSSQTQISRAAVGYRRKGWGKLRGGGHLLFQSVKKGTTVFAGQSGNNMTMVVAVADGPISQFTNWYIDGTEVTVDGSLNVTTTKYSGKAQFAYKLGSDSQTAFSELTSEFSAEVDSDWRGLGTVMILARFLCDKNTFNMLPKGVNTEISAVAEYSTIYDPRISMDAYSANAALVIRDQLTASALENGHGIPTEFIDDDDATYGFKAAADTCDLVVAGPEATTRAKWELHGWNNYGEAPSATLIRMFDACNGRLVLTSNGKIGISVGGWVEPTVTLTGDHITRIKRTEGKYESEQATVIKSQYLSPAHGYIEQDAKEYEHENFSSFGRKVKSVDFIMSANHGQCRHLQKIAANRINTGTSLEVSTNIYGLSVLGERFIKINYGDINTSFEIVSDPELILDRNGVVNGVEFAVIALTESDVSYDEETEGVTPPEVQPDPDNDLTPDAPTLSVTISGTTASCVITDQSDANYHFIRYRVVEGASPDDDGNYAYASMEPGVSATDIALMAGTTYEFQVKAVTGSGLESPYEPSPALQRTTS
ncbi:fibronectin type III domain-containing protein [Roseibium sp. Sym1]|uniref:fibronectin type III domain-containing protein n=1 Tax=Roseibium sp. Sym1 TaxID=3016006 RepID=UPI0022B3BA45|nr:fibronectin type III domain-containing protein [Roseibium sp. Sym1]